MGFVSPALLPSATLTPTTSVKINYHFPVPAIPLWSGGALIYLENNDTATPVIHTWNEQGIEQVPVAFTIADANLIRIETVNRAFDGTTALCGLAYDRTGRSGGFISWVSADDQTINTIQSFPYEPRLIALSPDGTVWTQGTEAISGNDRAKQVNWQSGVIRHYDRSGKLLNSLIPRSKIDDTPEDIAGLRHGFLGLSGDTLGWYLDYAQKYVELSVSTGAVNVYEGVPISGLGSHVYFFAMTQTGEVFVAARASNGPMSLYSFDRITHKWVNTILPAHNDPQASTTLQGSFGNTLAFITNDGQRQYRFFQVAH